MAAPHYTIADIRRSYGAGKAREEWYGEWAAALIYRPLSFVITPTLLRLSLSATAVTVASLIAACALPVIAASGGNYVVVAAAALLVGILDCADGNIARVTQTVSRLGQYLDFLTDILFRIALYAAIAILAAPHSGWPLAIALAAALLATAARLCRINARRFWQDSIYDRPEENGRPSGFLERILFPAISGIEGLLPVIVLVAGFARMLDAVLFWLVLYSAVDFLYTQATILRRLAKGGQGG